MEHHFEVYQDKAGAFRFRFRANNGNIMASSSEAWGTRYDARQAIKRIKEGKTKTELYVDAAGEYRWRMLLDGDIIATGSEGYSAQRSCKQSLASVRKRAREADVMEL